MGQPVGATFKKNLSDHQFSLIIYEHDCYKTIKPTLLMSPVKQLHV